MEKLNVVIADDHPIVLLGVRELVERDGRFQIVGEAGCSNELVQLLTGQPVDLIITDFNMPAESPYGDGLKLVKYLTRQYPTLPILVLTMMSNPLTLTFLRELGVAGVIQKNQLHEEIERALEAVCSSAEHISTVSPHTPPVSTTVSLDERFANLSPKEHEILRLFVTGQSVSDIARGQNRSVKTISTQKLSAMRKLGATRDQDLVAYCIEGKIFS